MLIYAYIGWYCVKSLMGFERRTIMKVLVNTVLVLIFALALTVAFVLTNVYAGDVDTAQEATKTVQTAQVADEAGK